MSSEQDLAVAQIRAAGMKKKVNAESWNDDYEDLLAEWGEKAAGLRFMHAGSSGYWRSVSNNLTLYSIIATTIASAASLVAGSIDDVNSKDAVLYAAGGIGLVTSFIQSLKKFYNADEKAAEHGAIAKQFGSYYRYLTLQMGMSREDRRPSDELSEWALKEYERLQMEALPLRGTDVATYKKTFKASEQAMPDNCRSDYKIKIYSRPDTVKLSRASIEMESNV